MIFKYAPFGLVVLISMTACDTNNNSNTSEEALKLYHESVTLLQEAGNKMKNANDSAHILEAFNNAEKGLQKLNYEYSAGTDEKIPESANDTLISIIKELRQTRDSLLRTDRITHRVYTDTIPEMNN